jgi:hypothetical protein
MKPRRHTHVSPPVAGSASTSKRNRNSETSSDEDELLSIDDLAARLKRTPKAIRQAKYEGKLPPSALILGRPMWRRSVIEAWIAGRFDAAARAPH